MTSRKPFNLLNRIFGKPVSPARSESAALASLLGLAWVVEARDPYTGGHLWRVSRYATLLAEAAGLSSQEIALTTIGGFLHDLGKIAIPDAILRKSDRLTDDEYEIIKTHPEVGRNLIARHPFGHLVMDAVYGHHERPDGKGYPVGLTKDAIPAMSAIIGICDAFDAMTSARPYRKAMTVEAALQILRANLGTQFHNEYGDLFLRLGRDYNFHHIVEHSDDGIPLQHCVTCGPTIVVRSGTQTGEQIFCPACGTGYRFEDKLKPITLTGSKATASDLVQEPDGALIAKLLDRLPYAT